MKNKLKVVIKRADSRYGEVTEVVNELITWQKIVGGTIAIFPLTVGILAIINDNGKVLDLRPNFSVPYDNGYNELIVGDVAICSCRDDDFDSLNDEQLGFLKAVGMIK